MLVSQLIEKLQKCDQNARVCVESNPNPCAKQVVQYSNKSGKEAYVYICDNTKYIDGVVKKSLLEGKRKI